MVIADILIHQAFQMAFIENDHMVEQIAAPVANPAPGNTVLPRTSEAGALGLDAEALYCVNYLSIETGATIKDQIPVPPEYRSAGRPRA
jgi:hypothetical protein